jgi:hypothetical protein
MLFNTSSWSLGRVFSLLKYCKYVFTRCTVFYIYIYISSSSSFFLLKKKSYVVVIIYIK